MIGDNHIRFILYFILLGAGSGLIIFPGDFWPNKRPIFSAEISPSGAIFGASCFLLFIASIVDIRLN
jgi:hypothetical protein